MLVEDDNNLREIYEARLLAEGYEIVSARDGEEALALAVKERPDLIIADVMMPKISGFDMLDILRSTPETRNTKVIMMTALSQAEDKERAAQLGADRYLVKSQVTLEDVAKAAKEVMEGAPTPGMTTPPPPHNPTPPAVDPVAPVPEPVQATPSPVFNDDTSAQPVVQAYPVQTTAQEAKEVQDQIGEFIKAPVTVIKPSTAIPMQEEKPATPPVMPVSVTPEASSTTSAPSTYNKSNTSVHSRVIEPISNDRGIQRPDLTALLAKEEKNEKIAEAIKPIIDHTAAAAPTPTENIPVVDPNSVSL